MPITSFSLTWDGIRLYSFTFFFVIAGVAHFVFARQFAAIIPFLPYRTFIVYLTGLIEIGLGIGLLFPAYRNLLIWITIIYLLAIYPANIHMALNTQRYHFPPWILYARLPLQFVFIWWVYSLRHISS